MKRFLLPLLLAAAVIVAADARRIRTGPTKIPHMATAFAVVDTATQQADTIFAPARDHVKLSGYDKTLRAYKESFFVTNSLPDSVTIIELDLTLEYFDMAGRQLHKASPKVRCHIPPGETRQLTVPAWDKQHTFYYHLSPAPRSGSATPFKVSSVVNSAAVISESGAR